MYKSTAQQTNTTAFGGAMYAKNKILLYLPSAPSPTPDTIDELIALLVCRRHLSSIASHFHFAHFFFID
jgi:hypothetical protein